MAHDSIVSIPTHKCKGDSILGALSSKLHSAAQESCQTSAQGVSVAIVAQHRMVLDACPFQNSRTFRSMLLATPYVDNSLFVSQFQKAVEEATHSLEQSSQVKHLASSSSKGGQQASSQRPAHPQSPQKRSVQPPLHLPPQLLLSVRSRGSVV